MMLLFVAALTVAAYGQQWHSPLYDPSTGARPTVTFAGRDWRLDDYSYAGYHLGVRAPASCTPRTIDAREGANIGEALIAAVATLRSQGGGTVRIPAGNFVLDRTVAVNFSNAAIEGAGSGKTVIRVPGAWKPQVVADEGLFTFGKAPGVWNQGWIAQGPLLTRVAAPIKRGDLHVDLEDASRVRVGDWVVVQQYFWTALVDRNSAQPNRWNDQGTDRTFSFSYLRQVIAKTENRIFVDAPIPWNLDPANNPVTLRATNGQMVENVGVRGLTLVFDANTNGDAGRPPAAAVHFEGVRNGYALDLEIRNITRYGVQVKSSARITAEDVRISGAQDYGGDGYGYAFHTHSSQNILHRNCSVEDTRHNFSSQRALTSYLIYTGCTSSNATQSDDTHHSFIHAGLWDNHTQTKGNVLQSYNRMDYSTGAYETLGSGGVWNFHGDGVRGRVNSGGGQVHIKPSPDGWGFVVGTSALAGTAGPETYDNTRGNPFRAGERMLRKAGLQTGTQADALRNVIYDGIGQSGIEPGSLYESQRQFRAGNPPQAFCSADYEIARPETPWAPGGWATIYGRAFPDDARVLIGDREIIPSYLSPTQINFRIPGDMLAPAAAPLRLTGGAGDALHVAIAPVAPAILAIAGWAADGASVTVYVTGIPGGEGLTATVGGVFAEILAVDDAGDGVWTVRIQTPRPDAPQPLKLTAGGTSSNVALLGN